MQRLVAISNRIANPESAKSSAGGLAVGLMDVLEQREGVWFGWNGEIVAGETQSNQLQQVIKQNIIYASIALTEEEHQLYYCQYANMVLWPAFHYRLDLMDYQKKAWQIYQKVNQRFAERLSGLLQPDDLLWVHDYHLIPLAAALYEQGQTQKIGFFLHIPFPCPAIFKAIPEYQQLIEQMTHYDVLGFQTESDKQAFLLCLQAETAVKKLANGRYSAWGRSFVIQAYPIGIDADNIQRLAETPLPAKFQEIRRELGEAKNIIACERLDYTKGIPQRFHAYEQLLANYPQHRGRIRYTQIAPTSRGEVFAYQNIRHQLETEAGRINSQYGSMSWTPLFYLNQHFERRLLMKIFRLTDIALITPLRDGMNLIAKEYVAAQDPLAPGVLILSRFAGAAEELTGALLVNPYDSEAVAAAIDTAITMSKTERIERYQSMMEAIRDYPIARWGQCFLDDLKESRD